MTTTNLRQIVLLRRDLLTTLNWTMGSIIAQAIHASVDCLNTFKVDPAVLEYTSDSNRKAMTTIVLEVETHQQMDDLQTLLSKESIDFTLWIEQPENILTAIALKPCLKKEMPDFLKSLKLFGK